VTDANGASRLVISSNKTGEGSDLTVSGIAGLEIDGTKPMGLNPAAGTAGAVNGVAKNAQLTIDGLQVSSKSNTVSGAISGLTLNLTTVSPVSGGVATPTVVNVDANTKGLQTSIQTFVDAYNTLKNTIDTLSKATPDADGKLTVQAAFTGDAMPRALIASVRAELTATGAGGPLAVLSQLGVMTDRNTGNLTFNNDAFNKTMAQPGMTGQVQQLFTGTDDSNGLLARMSKAVDPYLNPPANNKSVPSLLDQRMAILTKNTRNLTDQQTALDIRVENLTKTLTAKYNAMDLLVGQMKATASNITSFFSTLNAQQSAK
jgi:flagellar hook-associated protein 2